MTSSTRTAMRQFRQHPGFALITTLIVGLGTAAAATVYTVVDAVILRPLPYEARDRLEAAVREARRVVTPDVPMGPARTWGSMCVG